MRRSQRAIAVRLRCAPTSRTESNCVMLLEGVMEPLSLLGPKLFDEPERFRPRELIRSATW